MQVTPWLQHANGPPRADEASPTSATADKKRMRFMVSSPLKEGREQAARVNYGARDIAPRIARSASPGSKVQLGVDPSEFASSLDPGSLRVRGTLVVGSLNETVQVEAKLAQVDTTSANVNATVYGSQVQELALQVGGLVSVEEAGGVLSPIL